MKKIKTALDKEGFNGCLFEADPNAEKCMIIILGDKGDDFLNVAIAKYMAKLGINSFGFAKIQNKEKRNITSHWEIELVQKACEWLKLRGIKKIGIHGTSTGGSIALTCASLLPDISFVWAMTPNDYILEGQEEGRKEGMKRWCTGEGICLWKGKELPYHPYYMTPHELSDTISQATKENGELTFKKVMNHAEEHPILDEEYIKVENIRGHIFIAATEDDTMWNTHIYLPRIRKRLQDNGFKYPCEIYLYDYGTHFFYPERLYKECVPGIVAFFMPRMFKSGKNNMKKIRENRIDLQKKLDKALGDW